MELTGGFPPRSGIISDAAMGRKRTGRFGVLASRKLPLRSKPMLAVSRLKRFPRMQIPAASILALPKTEGHSPKG